MTFAAFQDRYKEVKEKDVLEDENTEDKRLNDPTGQEEEEGDVIDPSTGPQKRAASDAPASLREAKRHQTDPINGEYGDYGLKTKNGDADGLINGETHQVKSTNVANARSWLMPDNVGGWLDEPDETTSGKPNASHGESPGRRKRSQSRQRDSSSQRPNQDNGKRKSVERQTKPASSGWGTPPPKASGGGGGWGTPPPRNSRSSIFGGGWNTGNTGNSSPRASRRNSPPQERSKTRPKNAETKPVERPTPSQKQSTSAAWSTMEPQSPSPPSNNSSRAANGGGWGEPKSPPTEKSTPSHNTAQEAHGSGWGEPKSPTQESTPSNNSKQETNGGGWGEPKSPPTQKNTTTQDANGGGWGEPKSPQAQKNTPSINSTQESNGGGWGAQNSRPAQKRTASTSTIGGGWGSPKKKNGEVGGGWGAPSKPKPTTNKPESISRDSSAGGSNNQDTSKAASPQEPASPTENPTKNANPKSSDKVGGGWNTASESSSKVGGGWNSNTESTSKVGGGWGDPPSRSYNKPNAPSKNGFDAPQRDRPWEPREPDSPPRNPSRRDSPPRKIVGGGWGAPPQRQSPPRRPRSPSRPPMNSFDRRSKSRPRTSDRNFEPQRFRSPSRPPDRGRSASRPPDMRRRSPSRPPYREDMGRLRSQSRPRGPGFGYGQRDRSGSPQPIGNWRTESRPPSPPRWSQNDRGRYVPRSSDMNGGRGRSPPRRGPSRPRAIHPMEPDSPPPFDGGGGPDLYDIQDPGFSSRPSHRSVSRPRGGGWNEPPAPSRSRSVVRSQPTTPSHKRQVTQYWNDPHDGPPPGYFDNNAVDRQAGNMLDGIMGELGHTRSSYEIPSRRSVVRGSSRGRSRSRSTYNSRAIPTRRIRPPANPDEWNFSLRLKNKLVQCRAEPLALPFRRQPLPHEVKVSQLPPLSAFHSFMHLDHKIECPHWVYELFPMTPSDARAYEDFQTYLLRGRSEACAAMSLDVLGYKIIIMPPGQEARQVGYDNMQMVAVVRKNRRHQ